MIHKYRLKKALNWSIASVIIASVHVNFNFNSAEHEQATQEQMIGGRNEGEIEKKDE